MAASSQDALQIGDGLRFRTTTLKSSGVIPDRITVIRADAAAGAFTLTLPPVASVPGQVLIVKKIDSTSNIVTVAGSGAETVDGAASQPLTIQYQGIFLISDGTQWWLTDPIATGDFDGILITQPADVSGTPTPALKINAGAHSFVLNAEQTDVNINLARTVTFVGGGSAIPVQRAELLQAPTYSSSLAQTITTAATLAITGSPVAAGGMTITNPLALWVQSGNVQFGTVGSGLFWDSVNLTLQLPGTQLGAFLANPTTPFVAGTDNARIGKGVALGNPSGTIVATPSAGGLTGNYQYAYIEFDASGNPTGLSPITSVTASSNQYTLTVPQQRSGVIARTVVRTKAGGSTFFILHNFGSGDHVMQTGWVDNVADGSLVTAVGNTDTTKLYNYVSNTGSQYGGMFLCTHPNDQGNAVDLTVLTAGFLTGNFAADFYGCVSARGVNTNPCFYSRCTGTQAGLTHFTAGFLGATDDGTNATIVYQMLPHGEIQHTPFTTGVTNPTWHKLTGGVAGNYFVARLSSSVSQAGIYVGAANEPYIGSNINYSSGDTYSASVTGPWRMGNAAASTTIPFKLEVAAVGTAGNAITWATVFQTNSTGNKVGFGAAPIGVGGTDITLSSAASVSLTYNVTGGAADTKNWDFNFSGTTGSYRIINDAVNSATSYMVVVRSGMTVTSVSFPNGNFLHSSAGAGFFGAAAVAQQTRGATLTNNVTAGGVNDTIANYTDLTTYANDAAAIRNDIYQLARAVRMHDVALRALGFET